MDVGLDLEFFGDETIKVMRIFVSLLTLGIAFATNDRYGPGWNWLINLTFFECIIPVFLGNFDSELVANLNPLLVHSMILLGVTISSISGLIAAYRAATSSPCQHCSGIMAKVIVTVTNNETLVHEHSHELFSSLIKPEYQGDFPAVYVGRNFNDYENFDDGAVLIQRAEPKDQCKKKTA
jgi:hypothetical protein